MVVPSVRMCNCFFHQAFSDIKVYYNDIIHINLDVIKSLKENVAKLKAQEAQNEKLMFEISAVSP